MKTKVKGGWLQSYLLVAYTGGTDRALSLNGVAELRVKKEVEMEADGGTEDDLVYLTVSS